jgi:hypothetical protein
MDHALASQQQQQRKSLSLSLKHRNLPNYLPS